MTNEIEKTEKEIRVDIANAITKILKKSIREVKMWIGGNNVRIYLHRGYINIEKSDKSINIDRVGGHFFMDVEKALEDNGYTTYR